MASRAIHLWTLSGLISAFVDLAIAYVLLCGSAFAFLPSKFLSFFGLYLPCPCSGVFEYQNRDLCLHKLLIDWPTSKINYVQELVSRRFPFDLVWFKEISGNLHVEGVRDRKCENGVLELDRVACSSLFSVPRLQNSVDGDGGCDVKGKKVMNQRPKSGIKRRRRAAPGYGKFSTVSSSNSMRSVGIGVPRSTDDGGAEIRSEISENLGPAGGMEDGLSDNRNARSGVDLGERVWSSFELSGSYGKGGGFNKDSSSVEKFTFSAEDGLGSVGNNANAIKTLEQALEEEKTARAALYQELEKERAAAATAADEAMAMILRLQEDKASIEMEARHYLRMIEEKFTYDEEERNILKEILVRREWENHCLEKELEAYRQMNFSGNELLEDDASSNINNLSKRPSLSADSNESILLMPQQIGKSKTTVQKDSAAGSTILEQSHGPTFGAEMTPKHMGLASDSSTSQTILHKTVNFVVQEKAQRDISMISQTCGGIGEKLKKDENHLNQVGSIMHIPMLDTESTVYDVHVIDDKTTICEEDGGIGGGPSSSVPSNFGVCSTDKTTICEEDGGIGGGPSSSVPSNFGVCSTNESSDRPSTRTTEFEPDIHVSCLEMQCSSQLLVNSQCNMLSADAQRNSSSAVNNERLKIDTEVEWLRERLRTVQEEKEKLTFSAAHTEKVNAQLKTVEEIVNQLREIYQLRRPGRQASLPPLSKVSKKKRNCRSGSWEAFGSV